ncbi:MAG: restriction endonuclease [Pirellulaceae bacterium]
MPIAHFDVGSLYSSDEIQVGLEVGNAGGVRVSLNDDKTPKRLVIMTSVEDARQKTENPYHDRTEGSVLVYTGAGREGDQTLAGVNRRISEQLEPLFPIYGFILIGSRRDKTIGPKRWKFLGLLEYLRHYQERQLDVRGTMRAAWVFELHIHSEPQEVYVESDSIAMMAVAESRRATALDSPDERQVVIASEGELAITASQLLRIEAERSRLLACSPRDFELTIQNALIGAGFSRVEVTQYSQDGGIDVNAYASPLMWPITGTLVQVQAKRWLHTVGRREVAELRGSLQPFARGAVVTTSYFSRAAIAEAASIGKTPIVLIDGFAFASILTNASNVRLA